MVEFLARSLSRNGEPSIPASARPSSSRSAGIDGCSGAHAGQGAAGPDLPRVVQVVHEHDPKEVRGGLAVASRDGPLQSLFTARVEARGENLMGLLQEVSRSSYPRCLPEPPRRTARKLV